MKFKKSPKKTKRKRRRKISRSKVLARRYLKILGSILKFLLIASLCGAAGYLILFSSLFKIETIVVEGTQAYVSPHDVVLLAENSAKGENIFKLDKEELVEKLEANLLGAKSYSIKKDYPATIKIKVIERVPIAIIYQDSDEHYLIDDDGFVLGYTDSEGQNLPKIHYEKDIKIGLFIDKNLVPIYLELTKLFLQEDVSVSSMSFSPKHVNLYLDGGETVLIGNQKNKQEALQSVSSLIKESELEGKEIRRIDFRYDKVIVLFK